MSRERTRRFVDDMLASLVLGEHVNFAASVFHSAFGDVAIGQGGGPVGTTIRPWADRNAIMFQVEPDTTRDLVKVTRIAWQKSHA